MGGAKHLIAAGAEFGFACFLGFGDEAGGELAVFEDEAEADGGRANVGGDFVEVAGVEAFLIEVGPGAAAKVGGGAGFGIGVGGPFPGVAGDVEEAVGARGELADRGGVAEVVFVGGDVAFGEVADACGGRPTESPREAALVTEAFFGGEIFAGFASADHAASGTPLDVGGQAIELGGGEGSGGAFGVSEPFAEGGGVLEIDADDGVIVALGKVGGEGPGVAGGLDEGFEVLESGLGGSELDGGAWDGGELEAEAALVGGGGVLAVAQWSQEERNRCASSEGWEQGFRELGEHGLPVLGANAGNSKQKTVTHSRVVWS